MLKATPVSLRLFAIHAAFVGLSLYLLYFFLTPLAMIFVIACVLFEVIAYRRLDYLDPFVVFCLPWILILVFSLIPLSDYAITLHRETDRLVILAILAALLVTSPNLPARQQTLGWKKPRPSLLRPKFVLHCLDAIFVSLTVLNVLIAGYVPLIRGILTGDTGYLDFGVHGLYGVYLAFANAWGILHLVLYLRTRRLTHILRFVLVIVIFILFVTRQNLLSLTVESVIVFSLLRNRLKVRTLAIALLTAGVLFSIAGSFRSGDIKSLAKVRPEYLWVPAPVIWLYSYSFFNIANVNNLMFSSNAPFYDGSSLSQLIPSFLRPTYDTPSYLEVSNFTVSSYLYPMYQDLGVAGIVLLTMVALWVAQRQRRAFYARASLFRLGTFATLYFCSAFSFFVNFWFYLPVIFQIVFFAMMSNLAERSVQSHAEIAVRLEDALAGTAHRNV